MIAKKPKAPIGAASLSGSKTNFKPAAAGGLTDKRLGELRTDFESSSHNRLMQNAVTETSIDKVALNRDVVTTTDHSFSTVLDEWEVTNQKASGRCWMFAGLNLFRVGAMKKMRLKKFEFSQNHTLFWDKLERANYFLESIIETADRPVDDREVDFLISRPLDDGGQWNMFVNVIQRHGVVPQAAMPESESSSSTGKLNGNLVHKLRESAMILRDRAAKGASQKELRAAKQEMVAVAYRMLCIHLGTPPQTFDWQWRDKSNKFHRDPKMTPQKFAKKYIKNPLDDYVCLVHDPRPQNPTGKTYTVKYLGNVVGGGMVKYLNVDVETMKKVTMKTLLDGEPVWMGCDVGKMMQGQRGLWDADMFDFESVYGTDFSMSKSDRLSHHQTLMTHAMLFTGVDVVKGKARRWRVENSWGKDRGQNGFYTMNDNWFDEYMFEIAARKKYLPEKLKKALEQPPKVLPPWDPMGSLAR